MRPITLTFSGLRSYRDTTSIDFSTLDLFAILGDTGAGKSTIIEALSLALYAKKSWTGGPAGLADMIADGVNTMRVELRFSADDHEWVVTRARHRNASAPVDKLTSPSGGGPNVDGARPVTERITELVGLDHDQFTRAVVLPQGRFDMLLRASEKQRTEILSSILGLGDIAVTREQVTAVRDQWAERAMELKVRRDHLPVDPRSDLLAASARVAEAASRLEALRAARAAATDASGRVAHSRQHLDRLRAALTAVPAAPRDPAAELWALHARAAELHAERAAAAAAAAAADDALAVMDDRIARVRAGFATRDLMAAARASLTTVALAVDKDLDRVAALELELGEHQARVPPAGIDPTLAAAEAEARTLVDAARSAAGHADRRLREATDAWRELAEARRTAVAAGESVTAAEAPMLELERGAAAAQDALLRAERQAVEAAEAERAALVAGAVASAAAGCAAGDDCPVCARPLPAGFDPPPAPDDAAVRHALQTADAEVRRRRADQEAATRAVHVAERALGDARTRLATSAESVRERTNAALVIGLDVAAPDEAAALHPFASAVSAAGTGLHETERRREEATSAVAIAAARLEEARRTHAAGSSALRRELADARQRSADHAAVVAGLPDGWRPVLTRAAVDDVLGRLEDALEALDAIETERALALRSAQEGHARVAALDTLASREVAAPVTRILAATNVRAAALRELAAAAAELAGGVSPGDTGDLDDLDDLEHAAASGDLDALGTLAARAEQHTVRAPLIVAAAQAAVADLTDAHDEASRALTAILRDAGVGDLAELHGAIGRAESDQAVAAAAVADAEAAVAEITRIDRVRDVLDPFVANLKVLAVALRDQHFVAHLVRARESELLAEATRRLKDITGGRFGFTTGFGVVSIASGEVRTPDTLSGGERFQAALALALGLVEIASRGRGKLDAVFVDEGFGSLDAGALDTALDTLGKVAGGGKMVALISHLRPVAEYVDTVLHVTRDDVGGSRIDVLDTEAREQLLADDIRSGLTA